MPFLLTNNQHISQRVHFTPRWQAVLLPLLAIVSLCFGPLSAQSTSGTTSVVASFQQQLLDLPPSEGALEVEISFQLLAIDEINDESESFRFSGILTVTWQDPRQAFDPALSGVEEKVSNGAYQFNELSPAWYPQVVLANAMDTGDPQGILLRIQPDGTGTLVQAITATVRSKLDLHRYPFDRQKLEAYFCVLGFDESEVVLTTSQNGSATELSTLHVPQWELTGVSSRIGHSKSAFETNDASSLLIITIETRRKPFFMVRLVIMPLALIVMLSWSVFWMDRSSLGDRMSVSFVGILTAVAYQIMVSDIMPHISYVTLMNAILHISFIVMCATVVINLIVGSLDKKQKFIAGEKLDLRCRWYFPFAYAGLISIAFIVTFTCF